MSSQDDAHDDGGRRLDQIRLTGITATGYHGVFAHERRDGQTFVADVVVHMDTRRAAAGDDLAHTVDYGELALLVTAVLEGEPADLIETVAERIAATVLARPLVQAVDVALHKPQAPITVPFGDVVVSIRRDRTKLPAAEPYRPPTGQLRPAPDARQHPRTAALPVTAEPPSRTSALGAGASGLGAGATGLAPALPPVPAPPPPADLPALPPLPPAPPLPPVPPAPAGPATPPVGAPSVGSPPSGLPTGPLSSGPSSGPVPTGSVPAGPPTGPMPVPGPDVHRDGHDTGPDGLGAVAEGPAPTGAVPTGLMPAVAAAAAASAHPVVEHPEPARPASDHAVGDPVAFDDPAPTQLMAPLTDDVVEGELVQDALDEPPTHPVRAVLALGANLGPAQDTLRQAVADLAATPGIEMVAVSPLARTAAVGPEQPDYLNAVVLTRTTLAPRDLLRAVHAVEQRHGRERLEHWGPRTLDVDIVVYGETLAVTDDLELPHPRAHERAFVLQPWAQVDPDAVLPGLGGGPVAQLAATAPDRDGVRWMALDWLTAPVPAANPEPDAAGEAPAP